MCFYCWSGVFKRTITFHVRNFDCECNSHKCWNCGLCSWCFEAHAFKIFRWFIKPIDECHYRCLEVDPSFFIRLEYWHYLRLQSCVWIIIKNSFKSTWSEFNLNAYFKHNTKRPIKWRCGYKKICNLILETNFRNVGSRSNGSLDSEAKCRKVFPFLEWLCCW